MTIEEARKIMAAATCMWIIAKLDANMHQFEVPTYSEQRLGTVPAESPEEAELRIRTEILDAAVIQYARELARENHKS